MLRPRVSALPGHIQAVYVQNVLKLYAAVLQRQEQAAPDPQDAARDADADAADAPGAAQEAAQLLLERLPQFVQSADLEVQERVSTATSAAMGPGPT